MGESESTKPAVSKPGWLRQEEPRLRSGAAQVGAEQARQAAKDYQTGGGRFKVEPKEPAKRS